MTSGIWGAGGHRQPETLPSDIGKEKVPNGIGHHKAPPDIGEQEAFPNDSGLPSWAAASAHAVPASPGWAAASAHRQLHRRSGRLHRPVAGAVPSWAAALAHAVATSPGCAAASARSAAASPDWGPVHCMG